MVTEEQKMHLYIRFISHWVLDEIWIQGDYGPISNNNVFQVLDSTEEDLYEEDKSYYEDDPEEPTITIFRTERSLMP